VWRCSVVAEKFGELNFKLACADGRVLDYFRQILHKSLTQAVGSGPQRGYLPMGALSVSEFFKFVAIEGRTVVASDSLRYSKRAKDFG